MKNGKTTIPSMVYLLIYLLGQWRHGYHRRHLLLYISRTKLCPAPSGYANQWGWMNIPSESPLGTDSLGILDKIVLIYHWYSLNSSHHEVGVGGRHKREKILYIYIYTHTHTHTHTYLWLIHMLHGGNQHSIVKQLSSNKFFFHSLFLNSVAISAPISKRQLPGFSSLKF